MLASARDCLFVVIVESVEEFDSMFVLSFDVAALIL